MMQEAFGFLTVLGRSVTPSPRAWRWFPLVGATLGGMVGGVWWCLAQVLSPVLAGALTVAVDLALTGMLHLDGLADAADGLLPHATRERRLEIMRAPDVGAFAVGAVAITLIVRTAAFASRPADVALVAALWCTSRTLVAVAPAWMSYARDHGLASAFLGPPASSWPASSWPASSWPASWWLALALVPAGAAAAATIGWRGPVAVGAALLGAGGVLALARVRVGGFTGDVLGAAIIVGETAGLVVAALR
jgi:adenosylcobinamide-GDP ribazoletransferase